MPDVTTRGTSSELTYEQGDDQISETLLAVTGALTLTQVHNREHLVITSGTGALSLNTAATVLAALDVTHTSSTSIGWYVKISNNSGSSNTINLITGANTLNGVAGGSYVLKDNCSVIIGLDGVSGTLGYNILGEYDPDTAKLDENETVAGTWTFSNTISGDIDGNAATVTTNANLTGHVTSTGNAAVLGSFTVAQLSAALSDASISGNNSGDEASADLTTQGIVELATVAETNTGTDATRSVTPDGLDGWTGSAQVTTVGTLSSGNATAVVTAASVSAAGKVELATTAEAAAGTDTDRAVTAAGVEAHYDGKFATADLSFPTVATASEGTAQNWDHGLGTDDVDFGFSWETDNAADRPRLISVAAMGADVSYRYSGAAPTSITNPEIGSHAPAAGLIRVNIYNNVGNTRTITVHIWARKR